MTAAAAAARAVPVATHELPGATHELPGATHELPGTRRELPGPTLELPCTGDEARVQAARRAVAAVPDPELPALTLADLGIVRFVDVRADGVLDVGLSPTYTGCPATDHIAELVRRALEDAAVGEFAVRHVLAPAWSSDWITVEGRRKLDAYGIVPPEPAAAASSWRSSAAGLRPPACPRCHSASTETISEFGSTPCKALHRCLDCLEPFERFKCL